MLQQVTCACCAESCLRSTCEWMPTTSLDLSFLRYSYCDEVSIVTSPPLPYTLGPCKNILLDPLGVCLSPLDESSYHLNLCNSCLSAVKKKKVPILALANCTFLGPVPPQLKDLTPIEESMIALCCVKSWIVQLTEQDSDLTSPQNQCGFHRNIIIYPQQPQKIANILPPSVEEVTSPICVIFVQSSLPSASGSVKKQNPLLFGVIKYGKL